MEIENGVWILFLFLFLFLKLKMRFENGKQNVFWGGEGVDKG
jgi:hypothetical protein